MVTAALVVAARARVKGVASTVVEARARVEVAKVLVVVARMRGVAARVDTEVRGVVKREQARAGSATGPVLTGVKMEAGARARVAGTMAPEAEVTGKAAARTVVVAGEQGFPQACAEGALVGAEKEVRVMERAAVAVQEEAHAAEPEGAG